MNWRVDHNGVFVAEFKREREAMDWAEAQAKVNPGRWTVGKRQAVITFEGESHRFTTGQMAQKSTSAL